MDPEDQIKALRDAAARSLAKLQEQVAPLLEEIERKKREVSLLDDLLLLRGGEQGPLRLKSADLPPRRSSANMSVVENVKKILVEAGRPLHISEIRRIFLERGLAIPGQGKEANIIAHLTRSAEIQRIKRGFYALADSAPAEPTSSLSGSQERPRRRLRKTPRRRRVLHVKVTEAAQSGTPGRVG